MGGGSPIWTDTEYVADDLRKRLDGPVLTFHRYLPATYKEFAEQFNSLECDEICVFPMFPQFTYATTGSIALFFLKHLPRSVVEKMRWVQIVSHPPGLYTG